MLDETHLTPTEPARSPFLPGTQIQFAWDSTSIGYLKTCPRLYQYIMIEGWASQDESIHLRFGIEFHTAMQSFDIHRAEGRSHDDALCHVVHETLIRIKDWDPDVTTKAGNYKNPRTLLSLIIDRCDHFRNDGAETHLLKDGRPAVELSFRFELDWGPKAGRRWKEVPTAFVDGTYDNIIEPDGSQPYLLCGHLDRVVSFSDALYVRDYKTTTSTPGQYYFAQFSPSNQMTLYTVASQIVMEAPIKGVMIEACQIKLEEPNAFQVGFAHRTQDQLNEWLGDLRYWLAQAEAFATANYWPQNDTACDKFGGCKFREVCAKSPSVREAWLKGKFTKLAPEDRWNPLKAR